MKTTLLFCLVALAGCASGPEPAASELSDGTLLYTLRCDAGWEDCYRQADKVCGNAGFTEIDRAGDGAVSVAGRLERQHALDGDKSKFRYSENPQTDVFNRVIAIRCDTPK
jgi:hypothetical protein